MNKLKNIIIFGAGNCGRRHFQDIEGMFAESSKLPVEQPDKQKYQYHVVCFVDNDPQKQGNELYGRPIIAPEAIHSVDFDSIIIASIYETEIRRQLIQMRLEDKITSAFAHKQASAFSPVNFNEFNCSKEKIAADAHYAYSIAQGYIGKFRHGLATIQNKSILELGPGINFGTALILICWGAKKVTLCDRFLAQYSSQYHPLVYQAIIDLIKQDDENINVQPILDCINNQSHKTSQLLAVQSSLEELSAVLPNEFDITLSNAVFEHLYNPMTAFKSLYKCMSDGAIGCHQVDFRDHRDFDRPLEFLLLDELSFHTLMHDASCEFGNRVRAYQMQAMLINVGFNKVSLDINMNATDDYLKDFLVRLKSCQYSTFSEVNPEHLRAISGNFSIEK